MAEFCDSQPQVVGLRPCVSISIEYCLWHHILNRCDVLPQCRCRRIPHICASVGLAKSNSRRKIPCPRHQVYRVYSPLAARSNTFVRFWNFA